MKRNIFATLAMKPRKTVVEGINDYLLFNSPSANTEVGLLLGATGVSGEIARHAAKLYKEGRFKKIIVSGGVPVNKAKGVLSFMNSLDSDITINPNDIKSKETEAAYMRKVLIDNGVNADDITFVENKSQNTQENIQNCKAEIEEFSSVTLVTPAYSQRRALMTLRGNIETDPIVVTEPVYPFGTRRDNWHDKVIRYIVEGEMHKIDPSNPKNYVAEGYCVDVDLFHEFERVLGLEFTQRDPSISKLAVPKK